MPSLAPTNLEVRQVENEAGDCEVRLPLNFFRGLVSGGLGSLDLGFGS